MKTKEKTELKTLKDLYENTTDKEIVMVKELKAEAVKEINSLEEGKWKDVPKCFRGLGGRDKKILYDYIKWKNNITEEDLK